MITSPLVRQLIELAIQEDLALGDWTSQLALTEEHRSRWELIVKEEGIIAGLPLIALIFDVMHIDCSVILEVKEGSNINPGKVVAIGEGRSRDLLAAERTILNIIQRMSGVATTTRRYVDQAQGMIVLDTRKTLPGWRILDKYAVTVGGGRNHRFSLGDMILVKNNHIDAGGGISKVMHAILAGKPAYMPVQIEVRTISELEEALNFAPTSIMLDNMDDATIVQAIDIIHRSPNRPLTEVSGGITSERFAALKKLGVSYVSVGALTTKAQNLDISMRLVGARS